MTLAPRPADEADANDALLLVYDAWNRLVEDYDGRRPRVASLGLSTQPAQGVSLRVPEAVIPEPLTVATVLASLGGAAGYLRRRV
jgi:hypothetical protein